MSASLTCTLCGTVNVVTAGRCIACGQVLAGGPPVPAGRDPYDDTPNEPPAPEPAMDGPTSPIEPVVRTPAPPPAPAPAPAPAPVTARAAPPAIPRTPAPPAVPRVAASATAVSSAAVSSASPPTGTASVAAAPAPAPKTSSKTGVVEEDLDASAKRRTVGTTVSAKVKSSPTTGVVVARPTPAPAPPPPPTPPAPVSVPVPKADEPDANDRTDESVPVEKPKRKERAEDDSSPEGRYVVRLLLPEGDKRLAEIGRDRVGLGSGLDELGLTGDPRIRPSEAFLYVKDGKLWVEPADGAQGVYKRVTAEEKLKAGDVVLMGDIAAIFEHVAESPPLDEGRMVVGGGSSTPCGRLVFLRKDGSPGAVHDLPAGKTIIGRTDGHVNFPSDSRLSRRHVRFFASEESVTVEDLDSRNGTYLRVRARAALDVGDALRLGSAGLQIRSRA